MRLFYRLAPVTNDGPYFLIKDNGHSPGTYVIGTQALSASMKDSVEPNGEIAIPERSYPMMKTLLDYLEAAPHTGEIIFRPKIIAVELTNGKTGGKVKDKTFSLPLGAAGK